MWPLERLRRPVSAREWLRLGRTSGERWLESKAGLEQVGEQTLPEDAVAHPRSLVSALSRLYAQPVQGPVGVLLESCWSPLLLADTGGTLLSPQALQDWMRHRLRLLHGTSQDDLSDWDVRVNGQPGDRYVLGHGLSPGVKQSLIEAATHLVPRGGEIACLQPAFTWGWQRIRPELGWLGRSGWRVWLEQDRWLLARVESDELIALSPGLLLDVQSVERAVAVEEIRLGCRHPGQPIAAAAWTACGDVPNPAGRVRWHILGGELQKGSP